VECLAPVEELLLALDDFLLRLIRGLVGVVLLLVRQLDARVDGGQLLLLDLGKRLGLGAARAGFRNARIGLALGRLGRLELAPDPLLAPNRDDIDEAERLGDALPRRCLLYTI
jgi:hypothetical protein